jgi:hypothetical protein
MEWYFSAMKRFFKKHAGVIIGAFYALILWLVFNIHGAEIFHPTVRLAVYPLIYGY